MNLINKLLHSIQSKANLFNCAENINPDIKDTFQECCNLCFKNLAYEEEQFLKIDSVCDFLHDELNTGHWSEVPVSARHAFAGASFIKAIIILKNPAGDAATLLRDALKCVDMGLLLGAPLDENQELLTLSATALSQELNKLQSERLKPCPTAKRKQPCGFQDSYNTLNGTEVIALKCPSVEAFRKLHFTQQVPAKLQDCMSHWLATKRWLDVNYLLEVAGNRTVPVEIGSHYTDESWTQKLMSLKDFIRDHYLEEHGATGYLAQHNLFDQIPELKCDICIPEYCGLSRDYGSAADPDINAWFGPKGTVSPLHYDPKDNLLAQVFGTKQVVLFSPTDSDYLYAHEDGLLFNTAQVDPIEPNLTKHPRFCQAKPHKCLLEAGEMLYIPPKWWHHVTALEKSFSVSFWWQ